MTHIRVKRFSAWFAALALMVGLFLVWHGSSYQAVFDLPNLGLLPAREIGADRLFQVLLGVDALVVAAVSYRFSRRQF
jgi:predicted small integral membrane protein